MIKPFGVHVLIELLDGETVEQNIVIPGMVNKAYNQKARVIEVGDGIEYANGTKVDMDIKPGDIILYNRGCTYELDYQQNHYHLIRYYDIIAVIENYKNNEV